MARICCSGLGSRRSTCRSRRSRRGLILAGAAARRVGFKPRSSSVETGTCLYDLPRAEVRCEL